MPSSYLPKLDRAREHRKTLEDKEREFFDQQPAPARIEGSYNEDRSVYSFRFHVDQQPPDRYALIIGDFLTNLMASLDHLVYELSSVKDKDERQERIGFPICLTPENFNAEEKGERLVGIKKPVVDVIREFQPFSRSAAKPESDELWLLKTLVNWDKHRTLHVTVAHPEWVRFHCIFPGQDPMGWAVKPRPAGPFRTGDIVAEFRVPEEYREVDEPIVSAMEAKLLFDENVPSPTAERWWAALLLQRLYHYVGERVLPAIANAGKLVFLIRPE